MVKAAAATSAAGGGVAKKPPHSSSRRSSSKPKQQHRRRLSIIEEIFDRPHPPVTTRKEKNKDKNKEERRQKKKDKKNSKKPAFLQTDAAAALMQMADRTDKMMMKKKKRKRSDDEGGPPVSTKPPYKKGTIKKEKRRPVASLKRAKAGPRFALPNVHFLHVKSIPWNDYAPYEEKHDETKLSSTATDRTTNLLEAELSRFASYVQLDAAERTFRNEFVQQVAVIVRKFRPHAQVHVFGSFATPAVCNYASDLDLVISDAIHDPPPAVVPVASTRPSAVVDDQVVVIDQEEQQQDLKVAARKVIPPKSPLVNSFVERKKVWLSALAKVDSSNETRGGGGGGGTAEDPFMVTASDDEDDDDDDDDTADPLERYRSDSVDSANLTFSINTTGGAGRAASLSPLASSALCRKSKFEERRQVQDCLRAVRKRLLHIKTIKGIQFISAARVPILKLNTDFAMEVDICLQEGQGTDTRLFATDCVQLYGRSFSDVVLVLKVLLHQQGLDVPFDGGLGSFKLYALLSRYLSSSESESTMTASTTSGSSLTAVLIGFFQAFGQYNRRIYLFDLPHCNDRTEVDLTPVHKLDDIVEFFLACRERLKEYGKLAAIVDTGKLTMDRERRRQLCRKAAARATCGKSAAATAAGGGRRDGGEASLHRPLAAAR